MLSAQATDKSVNLATAELFQKANTPEKMVKLGVAGLEQYIKRIGALPYEGEERSGALEDAARGALRPVPQNREALERLPGVGRKTANVVLNTAFGQPTVAVDSTFSGSRIAPASHRGKILEVEEKLIKVTPPEYLKNAHHWLILHGRYVCLARKPGCPQCLIRDLAVQAENQG